MAFTKANTCVVTNCSVSTSAMLLFVRLLTWDSSLLAIFMEAPVLLLYAFQSSKAANGKVQG